MQIYDQHLHSEFSADSIQPMEQYVKAAKENGDELFVTTEHLDLQAHAYNGEDVMPNFAAQRQMGKRLTEKYGVEVLFGAEVGYRISLQKELEKIVAAQPFDVVLLSIHENNRYDFSDLRIRQTVNGQSRSKEEVFTEYLNLVKEMIINFKNYDVLAHVDFGLRGFVYSGDGKVNIAQFEQQMKEIFTILAKDGKALELNTCTVGLFGMEFLEAYTTWFLDCGGKYFSIGSDGHVLATHKRYFEETRKMLQEKGVQELSYYKKRKRFSISI